MLNKLSLKLKILLLCTLMSLLSITISYFAIDGVKDINRSNSQVINEIVPKQSDIDSMAIKFKEIRIELRTLGIEGLTEEQRNNAVNNAAYAVSKYEKMNKHYKAMNFHTGEKELYEQLNANWEHFKEIGLKVIKLEGQRAHKKEAILEMKNIFLKDCPEAASAFSNSLTALIAFHEKNLALYTAESKAITERSNKLIISMSLIGILIGLVISILFAHNATKLSNTINHIAYQLKESAKKVSDASTRIASTSDELSQATNTQASSLQETSSSIEEINSMIGSNTQNAKESA